jgi:hypothetical protein
MHTRYAGELTLLVVYGYQVKSNDDPFLNLETLRWGVPVPLSE